MLTAWGKKIAAIRTYNNNNNQNYIPIPYVNISSSSALPAMIEAKKYDGTTLYIIPSPSSQTYSFIASAINNSSFGVAVGSDGTAENVNDYTLGSQITGLTVSSTPSIETFCDTSNNEYVARLNYVISNDTGSDVTIREMGLFMKFRTATTRGANASNTTAVFMIDRTVLDSPVVIPNGSAGTVRYEFRYQA